MLEQGFSSKVFRVKPCFASSVLDMEEHGWGLVSSKVDADRSLLASGTSKADLGLNFSPSPPPCDKDKYEKLKSF